jgi:hypothetical protein
MLEPSHTRRRVVGLVFLWGQVGRAVAVGLLAIVSPLTAIYVYAPAQKVPLKIDVVFPG